MENVWKWIKIIAYWASIVRPVFDIVKGAVKGITEEIEKIKKEGEEI